MLDDATWFQPYVETARAEGFPWAHTGAAHSFPGMQDAEAFGPLVAEYALHGARPRSPYGDRGRAAATRMAVLCSSRRRARRVQMPSRPTDWR